MDVIYRIKFHIRMFLKGLQLRWEDFVNPKTDEEYLEEFEAYCAGGSPEDEAEIERTVQEHYDNEPKLDPRRTMLFHSRPEEHLCNSITASIYRQKIIETREWARRHGITTFLADFHTPFGLLALETLLELREAGDNFRVYAVKSRYFAKRKTYRTIPETGIEMAFLASRADYSYHGLPEEIVHSVFPNAATRCSERGIWIAKNKLPPYLLEAWEIE